MKKKLTIIGLLGFTFLFGCTQTQDEAGASKESEFTIVSEEKLGVRETITTLKHNKTGCYYITKNNYDGGGGLTVMMNKYGAPYCDKIK